MSLTLTVHNLRGAEGALVTRVRLSCTCAKQAVIDRTWDAAVVSESSAAQVASQGVARMVALIRRLGCRCPFDPSGIALVAEALRKRASGAPPADD